MDEPKNNEWNTFHLRSKKLSGPSRRWNQFLTTIYSNQQKSFFLKFWKPKIIIECEKTQELKLWDKNYLRFFSKVAATTKKLLELPVAKCSVKRQQTIFIQLKYKMLRNWNLIAI